ncbi:MAG: hypothetical protein SWY16_08080 [Cyanobacteriota bacterium]|nr:hypothetical protein [Cyanobacteriota bacterium]
MPAKKYVNFLCEIDENSLSKVRWVLLSNSPLQLNEVLPVAEIKMGISKKDAAAFEVQTAPIEDWEQLMEKF